jgi:MFS family permease
VSIIVVARRISKHSDPIVPKALLSIPSFRIAALATFVFGLGFFSMILALVLYLAQIANYTTLQAGLAISMLPIAATVSSNLSGHLADRFGFRAIAIPGMLLFTLGSLWLRARAGTDPDYLIDLVPGLLGIGAGPAILAGAGVSQVHSMHFSVAGAVSQTARQLSGAIGVAIVVVIITSQNSATPTVESFQWAFLYLASVAALASVLANRLPSRVLAKRCI